MLKVKSNFLRNFFVCVLIAFACLFGYLMLQNLCAELVIAWGWEERTTTGSLFEDGFLSAFLVIAIIFPVLEELIFRLFVCKSLQKLRLTGWYVIVVSAVIFMLFHINCRSSYNTGNNKYYNRRNYYFFNHSFYALGAPHA